MVGGWAEIDRHGVVSNSLNITLIVLYINHLKLVQRSLFRTFEVGAIPDKSWNYVSFLLQCLSGRYDYFLVKENGCTRWYLWSSA
jgi:hypothetical protein